MLSPSTAAYDRGLKFSHYRNLPSLQEYVLVDLYTRTTDCYRLGSDGLWELHPFAKVAKVALASVGMEITAEQLFAEVVEGFQPFADRGATMGNDLIHELPHMQGD